MAPLIFALLAATTPGHRLVLVVDPGGEAACEAVARIGSVVELTPKLRIARAPAKDGESLEAARARADADYAILPKPSADALEIEVRSRTKTTEAKVSTKRPDPVAEALATAWPPDAPQLLEARALGVPNRAAIAAACRGDAAAAYDASGAAVGRTIPALIAPPPKFKARGLLVDWARATARKNAGDCRNALGYLERTLAALERGALAPVWRRPPPNPEAKPSSLSVFGDLLVVFEAGAFVALDLVTGVERWRHDLGPSEPELVRTRRHLIAATESSVVAIDPNDGKIRWTLEAKAPDPEIAVRGGRLFIANGDGVVAVNDDNGSVAWRFDPLRAPTGGPRLVEGRLVVAVGPAIVVLDPDRGDEVRRIDLGDEIAAPLTVTPLGAVWALVGSDEIVRVDPERGAITMRTTAFVGAAWPPAVVAEQLVVAAKYRRRSTIAYVDPERANAVGRVIYGAIPPIVTLPDYSGVLYRQARPAAIIARDIRGNAKWTARFPGTVSSVAAYGDVVVGGVRRQAYVIDRKKGTVITTIDLDEDVIEIAYEQTGGAAVTVGGVIYGLPSGYDPRPAAWLREARLETAACRLALGRRTAARALAEKVLLRDATNLDARALVADTSPNDQAAVDAWREVMTTAPKADAAQKTAREALGKRIALTGFVAATPPIRAVVAAGDVLITRTDDGIAARSASAPEVVMWRAAPNEVSGTSGPLLAQGGSFLSATDGKKWTVTSTSNAWVVGSTVFRKKDPTNLEKTGIDGTAAWSQMVDDKQVVLDASDTHVLLADKTADGVVQVLDATDGSRRFLRNLGAPIEAGRLTGDVAVLLLEKQFRLLDAKTGDERKVVPRAAGPIVGFLRGTNGVVVAGGRRVQWLDTRLGRLANLMVTPADVRAIDIVAAEDGTARHLWVQHGDAAVWAYDLVRRRLTRRIPLGPLATFVRAGNHLAALEKSGALWVLDGRR